ncbi:GntR family transcriptional regulator [Kineothrix sp. MB12-C1]|uniref:GntR family transcriptional regulator n=1 Tax=Kineothrix sp. MB12-C1 TaxID=3070215 RepID=UPI0027D22672|nr:GntR family transcriptional regulator [Kineothrix sp. MB12-C1]WMC94501.1 GntR family transcriptional regulator [Kineothrix sp. MB12-C1]
MDILISSVSTQPIYEQIYTQIKNHIIAGVIKEGEALPSIRSLAKDLRISVITTKRAYDELEKDGFIYTIAGKGCFVAKTDIEFIKEENLKEIKEHMQKISELAAVSQLTGEDLARMLLLFHENRQQGKEKQEDKRR